MRKILVSVVLALVLVVSVAVPVFAASSQDVTVTAVPLYLSITINNNTWTINGLGGGSESGLINPNTTYYSNPVADGDDTTQPTEGGVLLAECYFTVTNAAGASTSDLVVTWGDFSGGGADMTNSNDGTNVGATYGAYAHYEGMTSYSTNKVIVQSSGSDTLYTDGLTAGTTLGWGVEILTQQNDWTSATPSTSTLTITAIAD